MFLEVKERPLQKVAPVAPVAPVEIPFDWKADAARRIRERGWWHSGSCDSRDDTICLGMAVYAAGGPDALQQVAYKICGYVQLEHYMQFETVARWNDKPERTLAEVFSILGQ